MLCKVLQHGLDYVASFVFLLCAVWCLKELWC